MRQYPGIPSHALPDTDADDFVPRLRNMLSTIDIYLQDTSAGFGRIQSGEVPSGSGDPVASGGTTSHHLLDDLTTYDDHSQYLYLAGRAAGQTLTGISGDTTTMKVLTVSGAGTLLELDGAGFSHPALHVINDGFAGGLIDIESRSASTPTDGLLPFRIRSAGVSLVAGIGWRGAITTFCNGAGTSGSISSATPSGTGITYGGSTTGGVVGPAFDGTTVGPLYLDMSAISNHTGTSIALKVTPTRGTIVVAGNAASAANVLGISDLTAQTASITATTLLTGGTSTAGMYRVSAYLKTTTAGSGGDVVKMTVSWNDGTGQTLDLPLLTTGGAATNHDLGTLNAHSQGEMVLNSAASQNVSFTTTVTKAGSPQYEIHVRIEALG